MTTQPATPQLPVGRWMVDPDASTLAFTTKHMFGTGTVKGTFAVSSGTVQFDETGTDIDAVIAAGSFSSSKPKRDTKVTSATFLDATSYPDITFHADGVIAAGDGWTVEGKVTVRGTSGSVVVRVTDVRPDGDAMMAVATCTIDRYAFGVTAMKGIAARRLTFDLSARFVRV